MKASINLGFTQNLALTPQLQQSIKLLQLSSLELEQELILAAENNPFLDFESEMSASSQEQAPIISEINSIKTTNHSFDDENDPIFEIAQESSLFKNLIDQIQLLRITDYEKSVIATLAGNLDEKGYLRLSVEELVQEIQPWVDENDESAYQQIHRALSFLQNLDPPGIGARDLKECLEIQLNRFPSDYKEKSVWKNSLRIITDFFYELGNKETVLIKKKLKLEDEDFLDALKCIRSLQHTPASAYEGNEKTYVLPDIFVKKYQGRWKAFANPSSFPKINIHSAYAKVIEESNKSSVSENVTQKLQEARWLVKNLNQRNDTILNVAQEIVRLQQNFFDYGPIAMRPLVLREIAEKLELHESTISRITTQKFLSCLQGTYEFKYFFSSQVQTLTGGNISSTAIQELILQLVKAEDPKKPLSDSSIEKLLSEKGFVVARRTIAKYRDILKIAPVHLRKKVKSLNYV
jgi:RNA polymerase sigma-54 factor